MTYKALVADFEEWYERLHPRVIGVVYLSCGQQDLAADATDEAFVVALERWTRVGSMEHPDAWLFRVALNVARRKGRRQALEGRLMRRYPSTEAPGATETRDPNPELWREVKNLPSRQRTAVLLRYVGDLPEAEIAQAMGVTRGTVSASLAAARQTLAERLGEVDDKTDTDLEAPRA